MQKRGNVRFSALRLLAVALAPVLYASAQDAEETTETPKPASAAAVDEAPAASSAAVPKPRLSARLRAQYEYRKQGSDKDTDFYGYVYGEGRDLRGGHIDVYSSARLKSDLDSKHSADSDSEDPFRSVDDSDGVDENRLLQLYADVHTRDRKAAARGGRQYIDIADYIQMDGIQAMFNENGDLGGRVYLGHPVSYYSSVSGDYAGGISFVGRPWEGNRSRLTLARYHDEDEDDDDQNYFVDIRQQLSEQMRVRGQLSLLNDEFRMGRADGFYYSPDGETDLSIGASYWGSFEAKTRAYSPLYNVLGEQDPYTYAYARLTQQIVPHWLISPGVSMRFADDEDYGNRDYENYDIALIYEPSRAFSASLSMEYWTVDDEDSTLGLSGEVRYRHGRAWEISGGASFAEYTYDTYSDLDYSVSGGQTIFTESGTVIEESPSVMTYFLRGKWRVTKRLTLRLQGDIEDDDEAEDLAYRGRGSMEVRF